MIEAPVHQEVLFFDDFLHQSADSVHWDHVHFEHPVYLDQIRIIPKDCVVQLKNGSNRSGRTYPKNFKIEFYAKNLNKKEEDSATLDKIGSILYNDEAEVAESSTNFSNNDLNNFILKPQSIPTDWLVIVGSYLSLSLALVGVKAKQSTPSNQQQATVVPPNFIIPPPQHQNMMIQPHNMPLKQQQGLLSPNLEIYSQQPGLPNRNLLNSPINNNMSVPLLPTPNLTIQQNNGLNVSNIHDFSNQYIAPQFNSNFASNNTNVRTSMDSNISPKLVNRYQMPPPQFPPPINQRTIPPRPNINNNNNTNTSPQFQIQNFNHQKQQQPSPTNITTNIPNKQSFHLNNTNKFPVNQTNQKMNQTKQVNGEPIASLTENILATTTTTPTNATSTGIATSDQSQPDQKLDAALIENDLEETNLTFLDSLAKLQENIAEADLSAYLTLDETADELNTINSTTKSVTNSQNVSDELEIIDELLNIDLTKKPRVIQNPILTKYEQMFCEKENDSVMTPVPEILESWKKILETEQKELNEEVLDVIEDLNNSLNRSITLCRIVATTKNYLDTFNSLTIQMLEFQVYTNDVDPKGFINKMRQLKLALKMANLTLNKFDSSTAENLIGKGLQSKLVNLIENRVSISEPMRLKCLACLNNSLQLQKGMHQFLKAQQYSRIMAFFNSNNSHKHSSRLIIAFSSLVTQVSFYEYLGHFAAKCSENLIKKNSTDISRSSEFIDEIFELLELIYAHCMRFINLNQHYTTELFVKESDEVDEEEDVEDLQVNEQADNDSPRKKFKSSVNQSLILEPADDQFNQIPMQPLFEKFPLKLVLANAPQPLSSMGTLLRWLDKFQILKYVLMLAAYIYDAAVCCENDLKKLVQLNELLEHFLNDVFNVTQANGYSHAGIEYLLSNQTLVKCMLDMLRSKEANLASTEIGKGAAKTDERCVFYSDSVRKIGKSIEVMSIVDGLIFNLNKLHVIGESGVAGESSEATFAMLLDSVDRMQMLAFAMNSASSLQIVDSLSAPDGNMSNRQIDCLLNWLEFSLIEKHYAQLLADPLTNNQLDTARCFMLNALIDIFFILVKSNQANWRLPETTPLSNARNENLLILTFSTSRSPTDYTQNLKRLTQYVSLLLSNLSVVSLRSPLLSKTVTSLNQALYKLIFIKDCIEPYSYMYDSPTTLLTSHSDLNAANLASVSSFYYKLDFLNRLIDHFKKTYEKNMNLYLLKQHYYLNCTSEKLKKITNNYLNSTIITLNIFNNIIRDVQSPPTSDLTLNLAKYSFNSSRQYKAKRYLGHLIGRNILQLCLKFLDKLNDYLIFYSTNKNDGNSYSSRASTRSLNRDQSGLLMSLIEPSLRLIKTLLKNLVKYNKFRDTTPLNTLFRFNTAFNHCIVFSLRQTTTELLDQQASLINSHIIDICMTYTVNPNCRINSNTSLCTAMYTELLSHAIEKPFHFNYTLSLISEVLPLPLPIPIPGNSDLVNGLEELQAVKKRSFLSDQLLSLFSNDSEIGLFDRLVRTLCNSSSHTETSGLLRRVFVQLTDVSEAVCFRVVKSMIEYGMDLFYELTTEKGLNSEDELEMEDKGSELEETGDEEACGDQIDESEVLVANNSENVCDIDSIYDTGLMDENSVLNQSSQQASPSSSSKNESFENHYQQTSVQKDTTQLTSYDQHNTDLSVTTTAIETSNHQKDNEIDSNNSSKSIKASADLQILRQQTLTRCFVQMIKFFTSLLATERLYVKFNPIRVQFILLLTKNKPHMKFLQDCLNYCNRTEINSITEPSATTTTNTAEVQLSIYALIQAILKYTPELLASEFSLKQFHFDDTTTSTAKENEIFPLVDLIQTTLVDHLYCLSSSKISYSILNCLILLCQLYRNYFYSNQTYDCNVDYINPLLKRHLKVPHLLNNFLKELDSKFDNTPVFIELFSKFLVYINLTIENLISHKQDRLKVDVNKLKDLFKWSSSNFNINNLHIDSISICKSIKSRPTNENSLDNLLVLIVNSEQSAKETAPNLIKEIKFCACHTKRLVNTLNQVKNTTEESILNMAELNSTYKTKPVYQLPSEADLIDLFTNRNVYSNEFDAKGLKNYETEWKTNKHLDNSSSDQYDDYIEIDLNEIKAAYSPQDMDVNSVHIYDKALYQKLKNSLEYLNLEDLFAESVIQTGSGSVSEVIKSDTGCKNELDSQKFKNSNVINTRTGLKYKAPMRGGHNSGQRGGSIGTNGSQRGGHDSFRARLPNTSRPPSLHVDEFYRLENANAKQQSSCNNNLVSIDTSAADLESDSSKTGVDSSDRATPDSVGGDSLNKINKDYISSGLITNSDKESLNNNAYNSINASGGAFGVMFANNGNVQNFNDESNKSKEPWKRNLSNPGINNNINNININNNENLTENLDMNPGHFGQNNIRFNSYNNNVNNGNNNFSVNLMNSRERSLSTGNLSSMNNDPYISQMLPPTMMPPGPIQQSFNRMPIPYNNQRILIDASDKMLDSGDRQVLSYSPSDNSNFSQQQPHLIQQQSPPQIIHVMPNQNLQIPPPIGLGNGIQPGVVPGMMPIINNINGNIQPQMNQQQQRFPMRGGYRGRRMFPTNNFSTRPQYQR